MSVGKKQLLFLIVGITILKFVVVLLIRPEIHRWEDHEIAVNIVNTGTFYIHWDGIINHTFQFPVYPYLLSVIYNITGVFSFAVICFHIVINGFSAYLLIGVFSFFAEQFRLPPVIRKHDSLIIMLSVIAFLLHPAINYYALCNVHPFTFDLFMLLALLYTTAVCVQKPSLYRLLAVGVTAGFVVLTRATLIAGLIPFLLFARSIALPQYLNPGIFNGKWHVFPKLAIVTVCIVAVITPWIVRNYQKDDVLGITSSSGKILWKGLLPDSEGSNYLANGKNYYSVLDSVEVEYLSGLSVTQQNEFFKQKYMELLSNHPGKWLNLYLVKLKNFWWFRSSIGNEYRVQMKQWLPYYKVLYVLVLCLTIVACFFIKKRAFFLLSVPVVLSLMQSFFYVETRHRLLIEPLMIFMAILGTLFLLRNKLIANSD